MKTAIIHARVELDTKAEAERVLRKLGMSPTEAIRIFYTQICLRGGLPFPVQVPSQLTSDTLAKSRHGEDVQECDDCGDRALRIMCRHVSV